jgi:pantothenate kinase
LYDRQRHEPVWRDTAAQRVSPEAGLIITEGNYLLLTEMPWSQLAGLLDETWWLDTPAWQARRWAIARHCRGGRTRDDAERHYERSDRLNAILVERSRRRPDRVVRLPAAPNR